jgi:hypothetical protein
VKFPIHVLTRAQERLFLDVFLPEKIDGSKNIFHRLNALATYSNRTLKTSQFYFHAGGDPLVQNPIFIPRSDEAPEGDGCGYRDGGAKANELARLGHNRHQGIEKPVAIIIVQLLLTGGG